MALDRFVVTMTGASNVLYDGLASDPIGALVECVRTGPAPVGEYEISITRDRTGDEVTGAGSVNADGSISLLWEYRAAVRLFHPTPTEPIDRADLGVDVGVPDVV